MTTVTAAVASRSRGAARTRSRSWCSSVSRPELVELSLPDPPERWAALGFTVEDEAISLGAVRIRLGAAAALHMSGLGDGHDLHGLPIVAATPQEGPPPARHDALGA